MPDEIRVVVDDLSDPIAVTANNGDTVIVDVSSTPLSVSTEDAVAVTIDAAEPVTVTVGPDWPVEAPGQAEDDRQHRAASAPAVRAGQVELGPLGDDAGRVDRVVRQVVVALDVVEVDRLRHAGHLVQLAQIGPQGGVVDDAAEVGIDNPQRPQTFLNF